MKDRADWLPTYESGLRAYRLIWAFATTVDKGFNGPGNYDCTKGREQNLWALLPALFDALRCIPRDRQGFRGWPSRAWPAWRDMTAFTNEVVDAWGWGWVDSDPAAREAERQRRLDAHEQKYLRPLCQAALAWEATDPPADEWDTNVAKYADRGRDRGWNATKMKREKSLEAFKKRHDKYVTTPFLGSCVPEWDMISRESKYRFTAAFGLANAMFTEQHGPALTPDWSWRDPQQQLAATAQSVSVDRGDDAGRVPAGEPQPAMHPLRRDETEADPEEILAKDREGTRNAGIAGRLVRLLQGKEKVSFEDAATDAWEDDQTDDAAIAQGVKRLSKRAEEMGLDLKYRTVNGYILKSTRQDESRT